ncbi:glycosyltransferase [Halolamina sediminis]|uniref:glycosyltransferase n=1 Tax=Halolamina sediminis TaxID=1480675 RepID=UPI0009AD32DE|nr:glycosyltransferase family 4 protein [Halolamina sediminis]
MALKVLLAPYFDGNQYLDMLDAHLNQQDVETTHESHSHPLWPLAVDALRNNINVIHLHWTHPYFLLGNYSDFERLPFSWLLSAFFAFAFVAQVWLCSYLDIRIVWTVHNRCNHERRHESIDHWVSRRIVGIADAVQVWDERTEQELEAYLGTPLDNIIRIPHGNYAPLYSPTDRDRETCRRELDLDPKKRTFLYFGRIRPYKQVPELLRTWCDLEPSNAQLMIAGNSKDEKTTQTIESLAADRDDVVLDIRYIPDKDLPRYFGACDVAVFPYQDIFNSGSVLLAMTFGRPFVAPRLGAIPSVDPGGNILYDPDDGLGSALERAVQTVRSDLDEVGEQNRSTALDHYDWKDVTVDLISVYRGEALEVQR